MFRDSYQQPEEKFRGLFKFSIWPDLELWFVLPQLRILQHSRKSHWTTCYLHAEISISVKSEDKISTRARANFLRHFGHQFVQGTDPEPSSPRARNWVLITVEMGWRVGDSALWLGEWEWGMAGGKPTLGKWWLFGMGWALTNAKDAELKSHSCWVLVKM